MNIYVPGKGPLKPKIVLLGEAPSYEEEVELQPFVGPSGKFLNGLLDDAGIPRSACWLTNVSKYAVAPNPKFGKKKTFIQRAIEAGIDLDQQIKELRNELNQLGPNVIVPLGASALWALTGKTKIQSFRGSILSGWGFKLVPTYHPAHLLHQEGDVKGYWNRSVVVLDLKRAKAQSEFPELRLPHRVLSIARGSYDVQDFIKTCGNNATHLSTDIEAIDCKPACVGIAFDKTYGLTIPLWNVRGISSIPDSDLVSCWQLLSELLFSLKHKKIGQNFNYDRDKLRRLGFLIRLITEDTMMKAFATNPEAPKNLAFNTSIYTEEPYYKDEGMYEGEVKDLLLGCARDACVTHEVCFAMEPYLQEMGLRPFYDNFLMPLYQLYGQIENVGFAVDEHVRFQLLRKYIEWDEKIRYRLFQLAGWYVNSGSWQQVSKLLYDQWKISYREGTGEETLTQLLNANAVKKPEHREGVELILEDRRVKKTVNQYLMALPDFDGRMRTSYFICLETGRSSTNQQEPPIRPAADVRNEAGQKKKQALGMAFQTITKHGDIGADVRTMLVPDEGCCFIQADSSQAEARVIFLLAREDLRLFDEHDLHALTASWFFGGSEFDYSKTNPNGADKIRFAGKTLRHAGHLGASKRRATTELNTQARKYKIDFRITEQVADNALKTFHAKQPNIKQVFQADVVKCLEKDRRLIAPVPYGIDAPIGGTRIFFERWTDELFRQSFSYLPQRAVSENTKRAMMAFNKRTEGEVPIIVESHDAFVSMPKIQYKQETAKIMKEELEKPIDFSKCSLPRGILVIPCDVEEGYNYKDLKKFKWIVEELNENVS